MAVGAYNYTRPLLFLPITIIALYRAWLGEGYTWGATGGMFLLKKA
jgi:hypothetical protein